MTDDLSAESTQTALTAFSTQHWPEQKATNAELVLTLVRTLLTGAGEGRQANQRALLSTGMSRCLIELSLASNAPSPLKAQALHALGDSLRTSPHNQDLFTSTQVSPLIPVVPESAPPHIEPDWQRAEPVPAILALVSMAVQGDPGLGHFALSPEGLRARAGALAAIEAYVTNNPDAQVSLVSSMTPPKATGGPQTAGSVLLSGIRTLPPPSSTEPFDSHGPLFSCLILSSILRDTESCKRLARELTFSGAEEEESVGLVHAIVGDLMLAQREQNLCAASPSASAHERMIEWSRVMVSYLILLIVWMWESPRSVREYLAESSNVQVVGVLNGLKLICLSKHNTADTTDYSSFWSRFSCSRSFGLFIKRFV